MSNQPARAIQFKFEVPDSLVNGCYANMMSVWNSPHEFTLDFAVTGQPLDPSADPLIIPTRVVARVKIPLAMAQDLLQALSKQVSLLESQIGQPIPRFEDKRPLYPPGPED
jgi:hypothetical protein